MFQWKKHRHNVKFTATCIVVVAMSLAGACMELAKPSVKPSDYGPPVPQNSLTSAPLAIRSVVNFQDEGLSSPGNLSDWKDLKNPKISFSTNQQLLAPWVTFPDEGINNHAVVRFGGQESLRMIQAEIPLGSAVLTVFRSFKFGTLLSSADGVRLELAPRDFPDGLWFYPGNDPAHATSPIQTTPENRLNDGRPHAIGFLRKVNESTLFLDGAQMETRHYAGIAVSTNAWTLGNNQENTDGYQGDVGGIWFLPASSGKDELLDSMCGLMTFFDIPKIRTSRCAD